jgi:hypothetical protein
LASSIICKNLTGLAWLRESFKIRERCSLLGVKSWAGHDACARVKKCWISSPTSFMRLLAAITAKCLHCLHIGVPHIIEAVRRFPDLQYLENSSFVFGLSFATITWTTHV